VAGPWSALAHRVRSTPRASVPPTFAAPPTFALPLTFAAVRLSAYRSRTRVLFETPLLPPQNGRRRRFPVIPTARDRLRPT
jgi:hypothetical protein